MIDDFVMEKLRASGNPRITSMLKLLSGKISCEIADKNPQMILEQKFRYVDPRYRNCKGIYRLSETNADYRKFLEEQRKLHGNGSKINIL
ncbi:MAG TPA: hypothetical protein VI894_00505 [Candidatus Nanoarchaeia archaeon]|nr:hypothetical protein [Candidatus Nanoarchaeia archaeon]